MFEKLLIATVLVAFSCVQLATTLECYSCNSKESCAIAQQPKITCTIAKAQETAKSMSNYYQKVPDITSENFRCLEINLIQLTNFTVENPQGAYWITLFENKGCIVDETNACFLSVKDEISGVHRSQCSTCNYNLCNGDGENNPGESNPGEDNGDDSANAYSSSVFTVFATVLSVLLMKSLFY